MDSLTEIAKVIAVGPEQIDIEIVDPKAYDKLEQKLQIGSYLQISNDDGCDEKLIAVIRSFRVKDKTVFADDSEESAPQFVISTQPVGRLVDEIFKRGGQQITIPPKRIEIASKGVLNSIYSSTAIESSMSFGTLAQDNSVRVVLDGDKFFSKHVGVVGSTGSGKSSTVAAILQQGIGQSNSQAAAGVLNNSHILIFDIHGEYRPAFPKASVMSATDLRLPYWLMNSEELEEMFIDSNEQNSHNQVSQFRNAVIRNKLRHNKQRPSVSVSYDAPIYFSLAEVINYLSNLNEEVISKAEGEGCPKLADGTLVSNRDDYYFTDRHTFIPAVNSGAKKATKGPFAGHFDRFLMRLEGRQQDARLQFLLAPRDLNDREYKTADFSEIFTSLIGYSKRSANVTIYDLSGIPFEVLSIVVSLISRLVFTFAFQLKKSQSAGDQKVPILLVLEEAHVYISRNDGAKFNSVRRAVERIAKEGRKYGVSLMIVSQRPSEISETVFSQCNNFVAMRLTNPTDQNYIQRLLPDSVVGLTESLSSLEQREALVIGDASPLPTLLMVDEIEDLPASTDIRFQSEWRKDWFDVNFESVVDAWRA